MAALEVRHPPVSPTAKMAVPQPDECMREHCAMSFEPPSISAIIPTFNEEHTIGSLLENLKELGAEEVIVADGNSVDRTVEIASTYARVIRSQTCRALQMNAGARASSGEVLLFLHADVRLGSGGVAAVRESLRDPELVGG